MLVVVVVRTQALLLCVLAGTTSCGRNQSGDVRATRIGQTAGAPLQHVHFDTALRDACGLPDFSMPTGLVRAPYLQKMGPHECELLWTSTSEASYTLDVTKPSGEEVGMFTSRVAPTHVLQVAKQHVAEVSGLEPGTLYCYALRDHEGVIVHDGGMRTAPASKSGTPVSFVAFGDSGYGGSDQRAVFAHVKDVAFDLALVTGDVAYPAGALSSYERNFFSVYAELLSTVSVFPVSGNHDYGTDDAAPFREVFSLPENGGPDGRERWYSFDWGDVHFVALDTERLGRPQADWLNADLADNELPWTVVLMHKSPYSSGDHGSSQEARALLSPVFEFHRVALVLAGHDHDYERTNVLNGVTYVVTGGGGRGTIKVGASSFTAFSHDVLHFVHVTVDDDALSLRAIDATGQEFDYTRISRMRE